MNIITAVRLTTVVPATVLHLLSLWKLVLALLQKEGMSGEVVIAGVVVVVVVAGVVAAISLVFGSAATLILCGV